MTESPCKHALVRASDHRCLTCNEQVPIDGRYILDGQATGLFDYTVYSVMAQTTDVGYSGPHPDVHASFLAAERVARLRRRAEDPRFPDPIIEAVRAIAGDDPEKFADLLAGIDIGFQPRTPEQNAAAMKTIMGQIEQGYFY